MKATSYSVKNYPSNIEVFVDDDNAIEHTCIHFDKGIMSNELSDIKSDITDHLDAVGFDYSEDFANEIAEKVHWYIA